MPDQLLELSASRFGNIDERPERAEGVRTGSQPAHRIRTGSRCASQKRRVSAVLPTPASPATRTSRPTEVDRTRLSSSSRKSMLSSRSSSAPLESGRSTLIAWLPTSRPPQVCAGRGFQQSPTSADARKVPAGGAMLPLPVPVQPTTRRCPRRRRAAAEAPAPTSTSVPVAPMPTSPHWKPDCASAPACRDAALVVCTAPLRLASPPGSATIVAWAADGTLAAAITRAPASPRLISLCISSSSITRRNRDPARLPW